MKKRLLTVFFISALLLVLFPSCKSYDSQLNFAEIKAKCQTNNIDLFNDNPYIVVMPQTPKAGIIFYPGALVSYEAYLPLMVECAVNDIACFIIQMPSDFAIMDTAAALRVQMRYTDIPSWYIAGHSLGGAMAADYVASNYNMFDGLILLAAYSTKNLRGTGLKVLSVYGSRDGVLKQASYQKYIANLPEKNTDFSTNFTEIVIEGGNHAGFANYGPQKGDNSFGTGSDSTMMTAKKQQALTAAAINSLVEQ